MGVFDVNGDDLQQLKDDDLRTLIGLLCEADYRKEGLSRRGIKWGGHQDAPDGGLDVVIDTAVSPESSDFVPLPNVGYQVKGPAMKPSDIKKEMCPKDRLRPAINELIDKQGAYIIVSAGSSTASETALSERIKAMKRAVADTPCHESLTLDFYDRGRIASWVRSHPNMNLWVHEKVGKSKSGWKPYGNWTKVPNDMADKYIVDDESRLSDRKDASIKGISVEQGIEQLRKILAKPGSSVRLVGLSGVGKTRLVQALFDEKIGKVSSLNQDQVCYTDNETMPSPSSDHFIEQLKAHGYRMIVVIDNCSSEEHARLAKACAGTKVSLITIEYDVRDDVPEQTEGVFELKGASNDLVEKLIKERFQHISVIDAHTIAKFSEGNARIALAIADTVAPGQSLASFKNNELFERLFFQGSKVDDGLLCSAQALSLVYSFDGQSIDEASHLSLLGGLVGKSGQEMYSDMQRLKRRDLVQARGNWRAVLPQALANWLARQALDNMHVDTLRKIFLSGTEDHLTKSFLHRLGYLHEHKTAQLVAYDVLSPNGVIENVERVFNEHEIDLLVNIAPVLPHEALSLLERIFKNDFSKLGSAQHLCRVAGLIRKIAYDQALFNRCVCLLSELALLDRKGGNYLATKPNLKVLFYVRASGTKASTSQRLECIEQLTNDSDTRKKKLGLELLGNVLTSRDIEPAYDYSFGARGRDFGYEPREDELVQWFAGALRVIENVAKPSNTLCEEARRLLADKLHDLWFFNGLHDLIIQIATSLQVDKTWFEGWLAVKRIEEFNSCGLSSSELTKLGALEEKLRPCSLEDKVTVLLIHGSYNLHFESDADLPQEQRVLDYAYKLAKEVLARPEVLKAISKVLTVTNDYCARQFGRGLASNAEDLLDVWGELSSAYIKTSKKERKVEVLCGFIDGCASVDCTIHSQILEGIVQNPAFDDHYPQIEAANRVLTTEGIARLHRVLGRLNFNVVDCGALGRVEFESKAVVGEYINFLRLMLKKPGGSLRAVDILIAFSYCEDFVSDDLGLIALEILAVYPFNGDRQGYRDYELSKLLMSSINDGTSFDAVAKICSNFKINISRNSISLVDYKKFLRKIAWVCPAVFLDEFLEDDTIKTYSYELLFSNIGGKQDNGNPMNMIADEILINWCDQKPQSRYPIVASVIHPFVDDGEKLSWKPIVYAIIDSAPNLEKVLTSLWGRVSNPIIRQGSLADLLQRQLVLFESLLKHNDTKVSSWADVRMKDLLKRIEQEQTMDDLNEEVRHLSFE